VPRHSPCRPGGATKRGPSIVIFHHSGKPETAIVAYSMVVPRARSRSIQPSVWRRISPCTKNHAPVQAASSAATTTPMMMTRLRVRRTMMRL
jgi:hypothetical protein